MEKILFTDTWKAIKKLVTKIPSVTHDDPIFRLHYRFTGLSLLFASVLVSGYQFFGEPIMCIQRDDIPQQLLNTYCWIEGTFTLPRALTMEVGNEVIYPGVDKYKPGDQVVEHAYYQWVCFVILFQAILFYLPRLLWKSLEGGKMKCLVTALKYPIVKEGDDQKKFCTEAQKKEYYTRLAQCINNRSFEHQKYALHFLLCEFLNLANVIIQLFFVDLFLGGHFLKYGINVIKYANEEQGNRLDPMIRVFPRITKCTFHRYGSSGDVQKHDALCLLPLNIINEKIFIIMWFWFIILAVLGSGLLVYRVIQMCSRKLRYLLLICVASFTDKRDIKQLIQKYESYGDWLVLYLIADNIDNIHFKEFTYYLLIEHEKMKSEKKDKTETNRNKDNRQKDKTENNTLDPNNDWKKMPAKEHNV